MSGPFVSIGHVARDEFSGEWRLGGTALYAAATAARLGRAVTLVTRVGERELPRVAAACAELHIRLDRLPSVSTTTFAHTFVEGKRHLRLLARARAIGAADLPATLDAAAPVCLASIAGEHDGSLFARVAGRSVLVAQGELRGFDVDGEVRARPWRRADEVLPTLRAVVLSEEDVAGERAPLEWSALAPVVLTRADRGASLLRGGREVLRAAAFRPAAIVDPTGAGDAFAAGLLVALDEDADWEQALVFANAVASFCLEGVATSGLADRARVDERLASGERLP